MKKAISIILILAIIIGLIVYIQDNKALTEGRFADFEAEFNARLSKVESELDTIKANTDTLKKGQKVIYEQVRKNERFSLWDIIR